jgi:hypothetical protein
MRVDTFIDLVGFGQGGCWRNDSRHLVEGGIGFGAESEGRRIEAKLRSKLAEAMFSWDG